MKPFVHSTLLLILAAALSCTRSPEPVPIDELGCPDATRSALAEAGSLDFVIYANGRWSGTLDNDWLTLADRPSLRQFDGEGDGTLTLVYTHNEGDTRKGTATLSLGRRTIYLTIIQRGDLTVDPGVEVTLTAASSSTLTFAFGEGETVAEKAAPAYRFSLFSDADTTMLVVAHKCNENSGNWGSAIPCFTFAGLAPDTDYWFAVTNLGSGKTSEILPAHTAAFTCVSPSAATAAEGSVILAEDFSEIPWNGDDVNGGAGFRAADVSVFTAPSGEYPDGGYGSRSYECLLYGADGFLTAADASRLSGWSFQTQEGTADNRRKVVFARAGYLKLGGYSWTGALVSPALSCIPEGKAARLKVSFTASRYNTDNENILVSLVSGEMSGHEFSVRSRTDHQMGLVTRAGWNGYTVTLDDARADSRLLIGPDWDRSGTGLGKSQHRMFLDDVTVEIEKLYDDVKVTDLSVRKIAFSEATLQWTASAGAEKYNIYLDGRPAGSVSPAAEHFTPSEGVFRLTGLEQAKEYAVSVSSVSSGIELPSEEQHFATRTTRIVEVSPTSVCVEWDELYDSAPTTLLTGQDRLYEMELFEDAACTRSLAHLWPFDGVKTNHYAFCSGGNTTSTHWNGLIDGVERQFRTRISIGCLQPDTSYWFRVRSRANQSLTGTNGTTLYTMTNSAGDSEWSAPMEVRTAQTRQSASNDVVFQGFDRYSIQRDVHNGCPGMSPKFTAESRATFNGTALPYADGVVLNTYKGMGDAYKAADFPAWFTTTTDTFRGYDFSGLSRRYDADGWWYGGAVFPEMGYLHLDSAKDICVVTPPLTRNLSEEGTSCTLAFDVFALHSSYRTAAKGYRIAILHPDGTVEEENATFAYRFEPLSAPTSATHFAYDTSWEHIARKVTLKSGDAVAIINNDGYRFMIDNIHIFVDR